MDRFAQIEPRVIFSVNAVVYNGKVHDHMTKLKEVVKGTVYLCFIIVENARAVIGCKPRFGFAIIVTMVECSTLFMLASSTLFKPVNHAVHFANWGCLRCNSYS